MQNNFKYKLERFRRFYRRNDSLFHCLGLVFCMHFVWWEVQQNKKFIPKEQRLEHIGPFKIPYLDDFDFFSKKKEITHSVEENKLKSLESSKKEE